MQFIHNIPDLIMCMYICVSYIYDIFPLNKIKQNLHANDIQVCYVI